MDSSAVALEAIEIISDLRAQLAKAHTQIVLLEREVAEKGQCNQELTDRLLLRVVQSPMQKGTRG